MTEGQKVVREGLSENLAFDRGLKTDKTATGTYLPWRVPDGGSTSGSAQDGPLGEWRHSNT